MEQEKREKQERERQASMNNDITTSNSSSSLLSDHDFERLRADVLGTQQGIPAQGLLPLTPQQQIMQNQSQRHSHSTFITQNQPVRQQFIQRTQQQSPLLPQPHIQNQIQNINNSLEQTTAIKAEGCSIPMFVANLQKPPSLPPDIIATEQDRQLQINYEQWLFTQESKLDRQRKYYEDEVSKLRKTRKALNSKQRALKKGGNDLCENDTRELNKITADQTFVQKQLENARKQSRQHMIVLNDYKTKHMTANMKLSRQQQINVS